LQAPALGTRYLPAPHDAHSESALEVQTRDAYRPLAQLAQAVQFRAPLAANVPFPHARHARSTAAEALHARDSTEPCGQAARHARSMQRVRFASVSCIAGQRAHAASPAAAFANPAAHSVQVPPPPRNRPAPQTQVERLLSGCEFTAHGRQGAAEAARWYLPAGQLTHASADALERRGCVPGPHTAHRTPVATSTRRRPSSSSLVLTTPH